MQTNQYRFGVKKSLLNCCVVCEVYATLLKSLLVRQLVAAEYRSFASAGVDVPISEAVGTT